MVEYDKVFIFNSSSTIVQWIVVKEHCAPLSIRHKIECTTQSETFYMHQQHFQENNER